MNGIAITKRAMIVGGVAALLGGCQIIPRAPRPAPPVATPTPPPTTGSLPADRQRHRVALLVPMTGSNAAVGQSIANATTMALLDTNASNLRITTYDTALGAQAAARRAVADGNRLILGPLLGEDMPAVVGEARTSRLPVIAFSNDSRRASADGFVMGQMPEQSIERSVRYLRGRGAQSFAILAPTGEYGKRAAAALRTAVVQHGGRVAGSEIYARGNTSVVSAAQRLRARGGFDSVLIADGGRIAAQAAQQLRGGSTRILGTELWSGDAAVARAPALAGAVFSAVPDARYRQFTASYRGRFGAPPYRLATLGYDAVLLTIRVARDWQVGRPFPTERLRDAGGFIGLDGAFRFGRDGVVERAMEVREVRGGAVTVVDPAPTRF